MDLKLYLRTYIDGDNKSITLYCHKYFQDFLSLNSLNENARFTGYNKQVGPRNIKWER